MALVGGAGQHNAAGEPGWLNGAMELGDGEAGREKWGASNVSHIYHNIAK
jgi:hypothetical protein